MPGKTPGSSNLPAILRLCVLTALCAALFPAGASRFVMAASAASDLPPQSPVVDMAPDSLAYLSVGEQIERFKAGTLSPADVLEAQIERIRKYNGPLNASGKELLDYKSFNGMVNAISYEHFAEAREAAKEAERRYREGTARSLEGITVAVKDENDVAGWRVTMGSVHLQDAPVAKENSALIDMLLAEGAILHIQTNVPELYLHSQTWSRLWGITRNPWNLYYAVGGSSGGSGAALAAGFTTLATGSDMGGSIRIPSSLCGVYGFRPPFGRVPTSEISYETLGPMARTFEDLVRMQNAIAGPNPKVHSSLRPKLAYPQEYADLKGVRIAVDYFDSWLDEGTDESVRKSLRDAVEVLRGEGAIVEEVKLGWRYNDLFTPFMGGLLSTAMGNMLVELKGMDPGKSTTYANQTLSLMGSKGPAEAARADELTTRLHRQLQDLIFANGYQALIMPTLATPYFPADNDPTTDTVPINGKRVGGTRFMMTFPWNMLSRYPVVDVPVGIAGNKVPMGMQVVGNTFDDLAAFRVAYGYSRAGLHLYGGGFFPDFRNSK